MHHSCHKEIKIVLVLANTSKVRSVRIYNMNVPHGSDCFDHVACRFCYLGESEHCVTFLRSSLKKRLRRRSKDLHLTEEIRDQNLVTGNCTQDLG